LNVVRYCYETFAQIESPKIYVLRTLTLQRSKGVEFQDALSLFHSTSASAIKVKQRDRVRASLLLSFLLASPAHSFSLLLSLFAMCANFISPSDKRTRAQSQNPAGWMEV
jgi:hypothetical protein